MSAHPTSGPPRSLLRDSGCSQGAAERAGNALRRARVVRYILAAIGLALVPAAMAEPREQDWSQTMAWSALAPHLPRNQSRIVVVAAADDQQTGRAGLVLQTALRASGQVESVLEGDLLGSVESLSDQAIVQKAAGLPVDAVAVVRLLGTEEQPSAVVNFYTLQGDLLAGLSAPMGQPLSPSHEGPGASALDGERARSPRSTAKQLALQEYAEHFVGFVGFGPANAEVTATTLRSLDAYRGSLQRPLQPAAFYTLMGHPEIGQAYTDRLAYSRRLFIGSAVSFGVGLAAVSISGAAVAGSLGTPSEEDIQTRFRLGVAGICVGLVGNIVSLSLLGAGIARYLDRHPVPPSEVLRMGDRYNRSLRRRLGLEALSVPAER